MTIITSLSDVREAGKQFDGYALVKSVQDATTNGGAPYLTISLGEKDKNITCKLWDRNFNNYSVAELRKNVFVVGSMLHIQGTTSEYRGEPQITITNFLPVKEGEVDIADYIASAPEPTEDMQKEYEQFLEDIQQPFLRTLCQEIYEEFKASFITYPAAKSNHHSFRSGLLYHSLSMLRLAKHICTQYNGINRDLVYAGIALHDLGKVVELTGFLAPDYTKVGDFLGHITIVNMFIDRKVQKFKEDIDKWSKADFELVYELMHIISAHHGKLEYGSPVEPKTLEAMVVHQIDMMDSRINMITNGLSDDSIQPNESKKIFPLGSFYKTTPTDIKS